MKFVLPPIRALALLALASLWIPVLAILPACLTDRDPSGGTRLSLFPLALCVWSPSTWDAAWNSTMVASITAVLSCLFGTAIAGLTGPWRYWGRGPARRLAGLPLALGPFLSVLGLGFLAERLRLADLLAEAAGRLLVFGITWETWVAWIVLITGYTLVGSIQVASAMESALDRIDPRWVEIGRALGASKSRARRDLVGPNLRPALAKAAAGVFSICLLEPGGPIAARLPRTLSFQVVEAVLRSADLSRAAVLVMIGVLVGWVGSALLGRWGGSATSESLSAKPNRAPWPRAGFSLLALTAWSLVGILPIAGFLVTLSGQGTTDERLTNLLSLIYYGLLDRGVGRVFLISAAVGVGAAVVDAFVVSALISRGGKFSGKLCARLIQPLGTIPAVGFGVGALAAAGLIEGFLGPGAGGWFDPIRNPGILIFAAACGTCLAIPARLAAEAREKSRPELFDAALAFGASTRQARRAARGPNRGLGTYARIAVSAATDLAPALLLCPTSDVRPLGPALLDLLENPERAAALAVPVVLIRILAGSPLRPGRLTTTVD